MSGHEKQDDIPPHPLGSFSFNLKTIHTLKPCIMSYQEYQRHAATVVKIPVINARLEVATRLGKGRHGTTSKRFRRDRKVLSITTLPRHYGICTLACLSATKVRYRRAVKGDPILFGHRSSE